MAFSLDARVWALLGAAHDRSLGPAELASMPLPEGMTAQQARGLVDALRNTQRLDLPFAAPADVASGTAPASWLYPTRLLVYLERCCLLAGANSPHVPTTLLTPEGRHLKLAMAVRDCRAGVAQMGVRIPAERASRVALEVERPTTDAERLLLQMFRLSVEELRSAASMPTPEDALELYGRCTRGLAPRAGGEAASGGRAAGGRAADGRGAATGGLAAGGASPDGADLAAVSRILDCAEQVGGALGALVCMQGFVEAAPFPGVNGFVGRALCSRMLRASGLALLSHLPFLDFTVRWQVGTLDGRAYRPVCAAREAVFATPGSREWTRYFEELLRYTVDEAWWLSNKLTRMAVRRRRLEELLRLEGSFDERQQAVLVEACVHDDAEFTIAGLTEGHDVAYSTAHDDLEALEEAGYLRSEKHGKRFYYVAGDDVMERLLGLLRERVPETCAGYFDEQGKLVGVELPGWDPEGPPRAPVAAVDYETDVRRNYPVVDTERRLAITKDGHRARR